MSAEKMHEGQIATDVGLVRRLLVGQFPAWAEFAIAPMASDGTAHAIYRLGDDLAVRLPYLVSPANLEQIDKEHRWLPRFAPHVPLALPVPLARGEPSDDYPGPWTVCRWLDGANATLDRLADPVAAAAELAQFIHALRRVDPTGGPAPGAHNFERGVPLARRDATTRDAIARCEGLVDVRAVTCAWETDLNVPRWEKPGVWIHGDLLPGNLIVRDGRLTGVIDWGGLGVGDPATDLLSAWALFEGESRAAFRDAMAVDDATWQRGRGVALSLAIVALPYYLVTNPAIVRRARHIIDAVLQDHRGSA